MGEGITLFVFYVSNCDCMERKRSSPKCRNLSEILWVLHYTRARTSVIMAFVLLLRDIDLKKLK